MDYLTKAFEFSVKYIYNPLVKLSGKIDDKVSQQNGWKSGFATAIGITLILKSFNSGNIFIMLVGGIVLFVAKKWWDDNDES